MALDTETLDQLLATVRRFVRDRLRPLEKQVAEQDKVPDDIIREMREMGLFGISIPEEYGGLGLSMEEEALVIAELCKASVAFRSVLGTNVGIGSQTIAIDGTEEQKRKYLPKIASGEYIASFCLTEPEAGSDAASLRTTVRKDGNEHYILNGTKRFITNAPTASIYTVMARTDPNEPGARGISAFIVERGTPGLSVGKPDKKMGQQGAHIADVILEDVRVPAANIIGGVPGQGFRTAMKTLDRGRVHVAAMCVGTAERLIEDSTRYAAEREQFGRPIGEFQLVQAMLADSRTEAYAARCMVLETARRFDRGAVISVDASCCKLFASEMAGRVADRAVQIHGGAGYMAEYGIERFYRDVRLFRIYDGSSQIQQLIIGRAMMKEART